MYFDLILKFYGSVRYQIRIRSPEHETASCRGPEVGNVFCLLLQQTQSPIDVL